MVSGNWRTTDLGESVWGKAVHRVVADGISPEQAVDDAIARIKQILQRVAGGAAGPLPSALCPLTTVL